MLARFPGLCGCGCRRTFAAGAELVRLLSGAWALATCRAPAGPTLVDFAAYLGAHLEPWQREVLEVLAGARRVAERARATRRVG